MPNKKQIYCKATQSSENVIIDVSIASFTMPIKGITKFLCGVVNVVAHIIIYVK